MSLDVAVPGDRETALLAEIGQLRQQLAAAEHASRKGDGRLRLLLDSAVYYAIVATELDGLVTLWNEGARRTLGWTEAEMLGQSVAAFFTLEDSQAGVPQAEMRSALRNGRSTDERWHQRKDGSRFWANGELMPVLNEAGAAQGFVKVLRDRTEQRNAAEKQRADAEFLRSILASSNDCIKVLDLDASLAFMTEGGQRVMEVSDFNAIRGCSWTDFWQGEGNAAARAAVAAAKAGGIGRFQGAADTMAGNPRYWDVQVTPILGPDGRPEKLLSVSRDVTEAHEAKQRLELALDAGTVVCTWTWDIPGDRRWCTRQIQGEMAPNPKLLCDDRLATDGIRASGRQHPVQHRHADGSLSLLGREAAGSQTRSDQRLVTTHCRFR